MVEDGLGVFGFAPAGDRGLEQGVQGLRFEDGAGEVVVTEVGGLFNDTDFDVGVLDS